MPLDQVDADETLKYHISLATGHGGFNPSNITHEEHQVLLQHINALRDQLSRRERETEVVLQQNNSDMSSVMDKNKQLEKLNIDLNKEYFAQRIRFEQNEHKIQQENELLRLKNVSLANQLSELQQTAHTENLITRDLLEKRSNEYAQDAKRQCREKQERLVMVKDQYKKVQSVYVEKITLLEENLNSLKTK